ncbi:type III restriction endonuclease subunit R [Candidatus Peregrinibacteria bacterium CG22_combo_CG10-13_8_21_14_all_49_11]|nr:MAG: type III restriction endonuclease subunit R [Candidatus Peregrinibacteria bacterium CG22_combo_CG10-13_8_21_14_all_49_11]
MPKQIEHLIINKPYQEPQCYWEYLPDTKDFNKHDGRRKAGYWRGSGTTKKGMDDQGEFVELPLVNQIRPRVRAWAKAGYPNVTGITRKLLEHWTTKEQRNEMPLFWCQLEAIETAIWLLEAPPSERTGIQVPNDEELLRYCFKLATGTGKTTVMGMIIAWQALNKMANNQDSRFTKHILIVAPGITVRDRLQVLYPSAEENIYSLFALVPHTLIQELCNPQVKILVRNWHVLAPKDDQGPKVVKKGPESDEAFVRRVLPEFGGATNILAINDEAHHCHRPTPDESKEEKEEATIWISGIDRIHRARGVLRVYDLSATPFRPTGHLSRGEQLFPWIVSDFGLNDAIESGLVKTPKIAVRDDTTTTKELLSKFFHIYVHIKDDLNRRAEATEPLPDLLRSAIDILGSDWLQKRDEWKSAGTQVPPVTIMIANRAETANRIEHALTHGQTAVNELGDTSKLLVIHQDALNKLESEEGASKDDAIQGERERFNSVGKIGKPGEDVQCVIGVNMLSEGWDARTVTHILGVRAFTSQLLCEQVIGRGLRRQSYDVNPETGMLEAEYVTVFGVPFTYLPVEGEGKGPSEEKPKIEIKPILERKELEIRWPHVIRVEYKLNYHLDVDWSKLTPLELRSDETPTIVELAPTIDGHPDFSKITRPDLEKLAGKERLASIMLKQAALLREQFKKSWPGDPGSHISQLKDLIDQFLVSDKLKMRIPSKDADLWRSITIALNMQKIVSHLAQFIRASSEEEPVAVLDPVRPMRSTATSATWRTSKPCQPVQKSQISHIVVDSQFEGSVAFELERDRIPGLVAWAKNDHLGFEIYYLYQGMVHIYYPDYLIRFEDGRTLVLEVKGKEDDKVKAKHAAAEEWVRAVNSLKSFGQWEFKVLRNSKDIFEVVK